MILKVLLQVMFHKLSWVFSLIDLVLIQFAVSSHPQNLSLVSGGQFGLTAGQARQLWLSLLLIGILTAMMVLTAWRELVSAC